MIYFNEINNPNYYQMFSTENYIDISGVSGQSVGACAELRNRHEHPPDSLLPSGYGGLDRSVVRVVSSLLYYSPLLSAHLTVLFT